MKLFRKLKELFPLYTHKRVVEITKDAMVASIYGTVNFIKNDTDIVDLNTDDVLENVEIRFKEGRNFLHVIENVSEELKKKGITLKLKQD